jgi:hypothetical protein
MRGTFRFASTRRYNPGEGRGAILKRRSEINIAIWVALAVAGFPPSLLPCSVALCGGRGVEMAPDFIVVPKLEPAHYLALRSRSRRLTPIGLGR